MGKAVLVIESDDALREALCSFLQHEGYVSWGARDAEQAVQMARALRPAAIIVGTIQTTEASWDLVAALDADPELSKIPRLLLIRALSGEGDETSLLDESSHAAHEHGPTRLPN
jgi:CheY-like chemotaxis protein